MLGRHRIKELRDERDLLMSHLGSMYVAAASRAKFDEAVLDNRVFAEEVKRKSRLDHTAELIPTPGFYEAVGPDRLYKSVWCQDQCPPEQMMESVCCSNGLYCELISFRLDV